PYPSSLMIGLMAEVEEGEATPDQTELEEVRWFTRAEARELIGAALPGARARLDGHRLPADQGLGGGVGTTSSGTGRRRRRRALRSGRRRSSAPRTPAASPGLPGGRPLRRRRRSP